MGELLKADSLSSSERRLCLLSFNDAHKRSRIGGVVGKYDYFKYIPKPADTDMTYIDRVIKFMSEPITTNGTGSVDRAFNIFGLNLFQMMVLDPATFEKLERYSNSLTEALVEDDENQEE